MLFRWSLDQQNDKNVSKEIQELTVASEQNTYDNGASFLSESVIWTNLLNDWFNDSLINVTYFIPEWDDVYHWIESLPNSWLVIKNPQKSCLFCFWMNQCFKQIRLLNDKKNVWSY